jgi:hypothetical protein
MRQTIAFTWTPRDGETVHLRAGTRFGPAGRYTLHLYRDHAFDIESPAGDRTATGCDELQALEQTFRLTPISSSELLRERSEVHLRSVAPLRGNRLGAMLHQHDASDLALFRAVNEPSLML